MIARTAPRAGQGDEVTLPRPVRQHADPLEAGSGVAVEDLSAPPSVAQGHGGLEQLAEHEGLPELGRGSGGQQQPVQRWGGRGSRQGGHRGDGGLGSGFRRVRGGNERAWSTGHRPCLGGLDALGWGRRGRLRSRRPARRCGSSDRPWRGGPRRSLGADDQDVLVARGRRDPGRHTLRSRGAGPAQGWIPGHGGLGRARRRGQPHRRPRSQGLPLGGTRGDLVLLAEELVQDPEDQEDRPDDQFDQEFIHRGSPFRASLRACPPVGGKSATTAAAGSAQVACGSRDSRRALPPVPAMADLISVSAWMLRRW
jgi:hypothetical protein